jgi:hypothetical protein
VNDYCAQFMQSLFCSEQNPTGEDPVVFAQYMESVGCGTENAVRVTAGELAQEAYGELPLTKPTPDRYPKGTLPDGRPYTVVNTYVWFWDDTSTWGSVSSPPVCVGTFCATAVARPSSLGFDPGDGASSVSCPGPGTAFDRSASSSWVPGPQPQGCDYRYTRSTYGTSGGELTATYSITWTVTWTATDGESGTLAPLQTTATSRFAVAELQSVVNP